MINKLKRAIMANDENHWSLDRRVPLAVIMTILAQFGAGLWMFAQQASKIEQLVQTDIKHEIVLTELTRGREDGAAKILVIDNTLRAITKQLDRIELQLDRRAKLDSDDAFTSPTRKVMP
jgi:hypothetical protein